MMPRASSKMPTTVPPISKQNKAAVVAEESTEPLDDGICSVRTDKISYQRHLDDQKLDQVENHHQARLRRHTQVLLAQFVHTRDERRAGESQDDTDDECLARSRLGQRPLPPRRRLALLLSVAVLAPGVQDAVTMESDPSHHDEDQHAKQNVDDASTRWRRPWLRSTRTRSGGHT
jgi:hypothetical protein